MPQWQHITNLNSKMISREVELEQLMSQPENAISRYNLIYAHEEDLEIVRKKRGKGFTYLIKGEPIKEKSELERIKSLVIPPMWNDVKISNLKNSHLQVVGRDAKNRKQYLYHTNWQKIRNTTKFYKMYSFGKKLPKIRKQLDIDLDKKGWPKEKVVALVIRLMEETHIRIGNSHYEKQNKTYGLTTLRKRHVNIYKGKLKIEFTGKKGIEHTISIRNKKLVKLVNRCEDLPGWTLFQFFDEDGIKRTLKSTHVNEYVHTLCGINFTAKDFRTWTASVSFLNALLELEKPSNQEEIKKNILKAYDMAADALGNTRNVCKKYYVHPVIIDAYESGSLHNKFNKIEKNTKTNDYLSPSEKEMLKLFKTYKPKLGTKK